MDNKKDLDFGLGDRDSVLKTLIKHDNSHMGPEAIENDVVRPVFYTDTNQPNRYTYWSSWAESPPTGIGISMVVCPSWGIIFPPYGTARLTGLLRHYGHRVCVHDVNILAHSYIQTKRLTNWWNSIYYYSWELPTYWDEVHPNIKPVLDEAVENVLKDNTDCIGFSLYQSNILASFYMIREIKQREPTKRIIVGGPEAFTDWFDTTVQQIGFDPSLVDFRVTGEGEQELLTLLENLDAYPNTPNKPAQVLGGFTSRLALDELPFPDYSDYNLSLYEHPDGTSIETSRGCVAKCSFCSETHFWKFRSTTAERTVEEMEYQTSKYGVKRFWFVDSLANGNFKEFKRLIELLKERQLGIKWNSYARNDGRMDLQMFQDIRDTGCTTLSFGVESGSQRVLDDMQKKVKVWEIEANLRDGKAVGMTNHCNWIVGFPTEGRQEFMHSMVLLWNTRKDMFAISPGYTCGDGPFTDLQLKWDKYDIAWNKKVGDNRFLSQWFTTGYANTILHRFIRLKFTNIWLDLMVDWADGTVINTQRRPSLKKSYRFQALRSKYSTRIEQTSESFNWFSHPDPVRNLSATLANEYTVFAWLLYKAFGPHDFSMSVSPDIDLPEFGTFVTNNYWSEVEWQVSRSGEMQFRLTHRFEHATLKDDPDVKNEVKMDFKNQTFTIRDNVQQVST